MKQCLFAVYGCKCVSCECVTQFIPNNEQRLTGFFTSWFLLHQKENDTREISFSLTTECKKCNNQINSLIVSAGWFKRFFI